MPRQERKLKRTDENLQEDWYRTLRIGYDSYALQHGGHCELTPGTTMYSMVGDCVTLVEEQFFSYRKLPCEVREHAILLTFVYKFGACTVTFLVIECS